MYSIKPRALNRHERALASIRSFMLDRTCYDILPESFRLIVLSDQLTVTRALVALQTNGELARSADRLKLRRGCLSSGLQRRASQVRRHVHAHRVRRGRGRASEVYSVIHVIQYYYKVTTSYAEAGEDVEGLTLERLRGAS